MAEKIPGNPFSHFESPLAIAYELRIANLISLSKSELASNVDPNEIAEKIFEMMNFETLWQREKRVSNEGDQS